MKHLCLPLPALTGLLCILLTQAWAMAALTVERALDEVLADPALIQKGDVLFAEDFSGGNLDQWSADPGWSVVDDPEGNGKCAHVVSSEEDHEDLVLKRLIPVDPGHPIAVLWRTRFVSGATALYLRVDYFDDSGKQGKPYARQAQSKQSAQWTDNVRLVSRHFPGYTRAMKVHFHHGPKAQTTSLLADIRVIDLAKPVAELVAAELSTYARMADGLAQGREQLPNTPAAKYWKRAIASHIDGLRTELRAAEQMDPGTEQWAEALGRPMCYVQRLADAAEALKSGTAATERALVYATRPITSRMVLPYSEELAGAVADTVQLTACPGESEPGSLVLWSPEDVPQVMVRAGDLRGAVGVIPAQNVDIKWVKCWFQGGGAPHTIALQRDQKSLVPELLLNDDELVKVDLEAGRNLLKLSFPAGPEYMPIDDTEVVPWGNKYSLEDYPVVDSPELLPTDIPAGQNKQVWLRVDVPDTAAAGVYSGQLTISSADHELGQITLQVRVLPLTLPAPRTHYDTGREFTYSLYYWGELDPEGAGTIGYKYKSEQQFRAELQYMYDRGIVSPAMIWSPKWVYGDEEFFRRHLAIMQELGMSGRPFVMADSGLIANPTKPAELEQLKANVHRTIEIAAEYGFTGVYFYGLDEARDDRLMSQMEAWAAVHEAGGKILVSGYAGHLEKVGHILDLFNRAGPSELADPAGWHAHGQKIWNYANPQTPVEDPEMYRRNYGLFLWKLDYDGACTYCFIDSSGRPWNDFDGTNYRDHNVAYPTVDGVVATLAMEGFREGADDVKYATALRLAIEDALEGAGAEAKGEAEQSLAWLQAMTPRDADLDETRAEIVQRLLRLRALGAK